MVLRKLVSDAVRLGIMKARTGEEHVQDLESPECFANIHMHSLPRLSPPNRGML